ncbi:MAG: transcription termination factor NusA [Spirochaetia bacterium]|nr:transcription termination factor NusA [Spirochaetia bacterium]
MVKSKLKNKTPDNMGKAFFDAIHQIVADKGFDKNEVIGIIETGLIAAYRKKYKTTENLRVMIDKEKEEVYLIANRAIVDNVVLPGMQIHIDEAVKHKVDAQIGEYIDIIEHPKDFGRIAAQTALQVVSQRLRQLELEKVKDEYSDKIGDLINGYILRKKGDTIYVDLGKVEAVMPVKHQIPGERYRIEDKIKVYLHSIENELKGSGLRVLVSRADKRFVQKLFEMEVPEIYDGSVEILNIGRIPGTRTKVVVHSSNSDVDPVGACVGIRGVRIQSIVRELGAERIDIIEFSEDAKEFIRNALSPAAPSLVNIDTVKKEALAIVSDKELSVAIGKDGSNVKLASLITGYRIDVKTESTFGTEMASPEARQRLDDLFSRESALKEEEEEEGTLLSELPGLAVRIIRILNENNINYIEDIVTMNEDELVNIEGIGRATAKKIMEVIAENVEFEEDDEIESSEDGNKSSVEESVEQDEKDSEE